MPVRIQRKRTKGWRMPENTVYVGRGSKWGNPFIVSTTDKFVIFGGIHCACVPTAADAVEQYRKTKLPLAPLVRDELAGKNLACWCALDQPCHADVLLELANRPTGEAG